MKHGSENTLDLSEFLENYLPTKFPDYRISGSNFMTNCVFCEDTIKKLGIDLSSGVWHCFHGSCEKRGDFTSLYAYLEKIPYDLAQIRLTYKIFLKDTPRPVQYRNLLRSYTVQEEMHNFIPIKPDSEWINENIRRSWFLLMDRKLFNLKDDSDNLFFTANEGFYKDRLVIPYTHKGTIIYFQARALYDGMKPKYLCASEGAHKIRGADVLYPFDLKQDYVVICEGPIDARSLQLQGVNATCITGVSMSETQVNALRLFGGKIIMGLDNDEPGLKGIWKADQLRRKKNMKSLYICHPPSEFKDWNDAHKVGFDLKKYVQENTIENTFEQKLLNKLNSIK